MVKTKKVSEVKKSKDDSKFLSQIAKNDVEDILITFADKDIKIKQYLPIEDKMVLIDIILRASFQLEDGVRKFKPSIKELMWVYYITQSYTDLKLPDDNFADGYDSLIKSGLFNEVMKNIPISEIEFLDDMVNKSINEEFKFIKRQSSFENIVARLLNQLAEFDIEKFAEQMKNLENVDILKEVFKNKVGE